MPLTLDSDDAAALWLTLRLATTVTVLLLACATPLAWWLAHTRSPFARVVSALVALPLVLPPTVLGFYLLLVLGPQGLVGQLTQALHLGVLPFTFPGLVVGSTLFSLPFAVQPLHNAFASIGRRPLEVAATLRARPLDQFLSVALPLARPGFLTAAILVFAHTIGEFGVVLMLGGNIPGQTRVLSVAMYNHVEAMDYPAAHALAAILLVGSFALLVGLRALGESPKQDRP